MTIPLMVLAALAALGGVMIFNNWIVDFLQPVTGTAPEESPPIPSWSISVITLAVVLVGVGLAWRFVQQAGVPRVAPVDVSFVTRAARNELYGNEINDALVVKPGGALVSTLTVIDERGIDGAVEGGALGVTGSGLILRRIQTGFVRSYALSLLAGALIVVVALLAVNAA